MLGREPLGPCPAISAVPLSPAWTSYSSCITHFPASQPPLGIEGSSQIKIAGKEQPLIVLRKRSEIRRVSCGVETASHTAVTPHPAEDRLPERLAVLLSLSKTLCVSSPRANDSYLGKEGDRCWPWRTMRESFFFFFKLEKNQSLHEGRDFADRSSFSHSKHTEGTQCAFFICSHGHHRGLLGAQRRTWLVAGGF